MTMTADAIDVQDFMIKLDSKFIACRVRHKWPDTIIPGQKIPKGLRFVPDPDRSGFYERRETCARCGKVRWRYTGYGGIHDRMETWAYIDPPGWIQAKGIGLTSTDVQEEYWRRIVEEGQIGD